MTTTNTLERKIFHACVHLAELGEYIDDTTLSVELSNDITINTVSDATSRATVILRSDVVFSAIELFDSEVEVIVFDTGDWVETIISEFEALTAKTSRS